MKPISADTVRTAAQGQWRSILPALGVPAETLRNQHQPCPCCGGRNRFRFDDKEGRGTFICSHWGNGGGDGFHPSPAAFPISAAATVSAFINVFCGAIVRDSPSKADQRIYMYL